jgi:predicted nucleotidyltransferase
MAESPILTRPPVGRTDPPRGFLRLPGGPPREVFPELLELLGRDPQGREARPIAPVVGLGVDAPAKNIAGLTVDQAKQLEAKILEVIPGAKEVWVFGSRTIGKSTSDIDVVVVGTFGENSRAVLRGAEKVQKFAKQMGIPRPEGKPNNPRVDLNFHESVDAFLKWSREQPNYDPSRGVPNLQRME